MEKGTFMKKGEVIEASSRRKEAKLATLLDSTGDRKKFRSRSRNLSVTHQQIPDAYGQSTGSDT
jgi:hypothetical protein